MTILERRAVGALTLAAGAALLLGGCSVLGSLTNQTVRDDQGAVVESNDDASAFDVAVGDCMNEPDGSSDVVETVPIVPCSQPHAYEAFASFRLDDGAFPGKDAVIAQADRDCTQAFPDFVGVAYEASTLDVTYYYPTEESWNGLGDREILCLIFDPAGEVSGSLEAAGR
ncbi:MAG: septum formation family protein [Actinomycetales bacterium]|nr:septum formation family protein [Actinomycetales bacterium]